MAEMSLPEWLKESRKEACPAGRGARPPGFIDRTLANFSSVVREVISTERYSARDGALQGLEPRAKLAGFFLMVAASAFTGSAVFLSGVLALSAVLSVMSRLGVGPLAKRVSPPVLFTLVLALPVTLGLVTPGAEAARFFGLTLTMEGLLTGGFFVLRVAAMVSLASLLALTTRQADFFRGLGRLAPGLFVTALFFTFRYVLILIKTAEDATLARKSRTVDGAGLRDSRRWFASRAALILKRSFNMAEDVSMAMISRGFAGKMAAVPAGALRGRDYFWLGFTSFVLFLSLGA